MFADFALRYFTIYFDENCEYAAHWFYDFDYRCEHNKKEDEVTKMLPENGKFWQFCATISNKKCYEELPWFKELEALEDTMRTDGLEFE